MGCWFVKIPNKHMAMRKGLVVALLLCMLTPQEAYSWGFWAHRRINRVAVFALPAEMYNFYRRHINYLTEHAVDPDRRRFGDPAEAPRHYIDIDHYGVYPFENVPRNWDSAVAKLSEDTLLEYGIVPWRVEEMYFKLRYAFEERNEPLILRYSADIGHYIADAHVPLHTTVNYNGKQTGQAGIHAFWESRLPELYGETYDYFVPQAKYKPHVLTTAWEAVLSSHLAVDSVLRFERDLTRRFPEDQKYSYEQRGVATRRQYSRAYSKAYHQRLDGMVERRLRQAIHTVASVWYTAWIDAGQPDLQGLQEVEVDPKKLEKLRLMEQQYRTGSWKGRPDL